MTPEPWSIDDMSPVEYAEWEAQQDADWQASPDRDFWQEQYAIASAGFPIPMWVEDDDKRTDEGRLEDDRTWLEIARWRHAQGNQPTARDLEVGYLFAVGQIPAKRGAPEKRVTARERRKRELKARYLRQYGLTQKEAAEAMGTGIKARDIDRLAAEADSPGFFSLADARDLDPELVAEIETDDALAREIKKVIAKRKPKP